jgi:curved DNA-binding protein CbpA
MMSGMTSSTVASPEDDAALAEDVDLDPELRRSVLVLHKRIEELDHYEVLGVDRASDRKAIKRAYYDLAAKYHPDRYFRKNLGSYKVRLEAIFNRVTLAHDTLSDRERRAEYDGYLEERRRARGLEAGMADAIEEAQRVEANLERQAQQTQQAQEERPISHTPPNVDIAARRDALARRLLGGRPSHPPREGATATSGAPPPLTAADAMASLRRRYEERVALAKAVEAKKYLANAEAALSANDPVAAANAFRIALRLAPDDSELQRKAADAQSKADALIAETYERQARYEEKNQEWEAAVRSWGRVCKVRPRDAEAHERMANAIVKARGDLHQASKIALQACELAPDNAQFRVTLALVYEAAGLGLNARRELERAAQLAPQDDNIRLMLKKL